MFHHVLLVVNLSVGGDCSAMTMHIHEMRDVQYDPSVACINIKKM